MVKKSKSLRFSSSFKNKRCVSKKSITKSKSKSKKNYRSKSKKGGSAGIRLNLNRYNNRNNK